MKQCGNLAIEIQVWNTGQILVLFETEKALQHFSDNYEKYECDLGGSKQFPHFLTLILWWIDNFFAKF